MEFVCKRCGNRDPRLVGKKKDGSLYCRACVSFYGKEATKTPRVKKKASYFLPFRLSKEQTVLSRKIIENYQKGIDTLVYAVCGSGKTEISYGVIAYAISHGGRVAFALPRRDVVIEIYYRLKDAFKGNKVVAVFGGHHEELEGDVIVLTTHQLFRYSSYFDLIVMDEIDAFPYKGNNVLQGFFKNALVGHSLLMSATPSSKVLEEYQKEGHDILELKTRFHKKPIPVPKVLKIPLPLQILRLISLLKKYQKESKPVFVFAPTIAEAETLFSRLKVFLKKGALLHSKVKGREEKLKGIKEGQLQYLVATSVLERGVTVKNLQVLIYHADLESIYDQATLIQIAGRAGRKKDAPEGDVYFFASRSTKSIEGAIHEIEECNRSL